MLRCMVDTRLINEEIYAHFTIAGCVLWDDNKHMYLGLRFR